MSLPPEHVWGVLVGPSSLTLNQGWVGAEGFWVKRQLDELVCQERLQPGQHLHCIAFSGFDGFCD